MKTCVFFDLETGGLDPTRHPIIQIAAAAADWATLDVIETYERKIEIDLACCEAEALRVNSYDPAVWSEEAKSPLESLREFADFLRRHACVEMTSKAGRPYKVAQLAAYNAAFDGEFLTYAYRSAELFLPAGWSVLCTLQRVRWHFAELGERLPSHRLGDVCQHMGITLANAHDAQHDNLAQIEVLRVIRRASGGRKAAPSVSD